MIYYTLTVPCEKSKMASLASSITKNIVVSPCSSKFPANLLYWFAFLSASSAYCLLKSIAISL